MNPEFMIDFEKDVTVQNKEKRNEQDDSLDSFTNSIISQYASGINPPVRKVESLKSNTLFQKENFTFGTPKDEDKDQNQKELPSLNSYLNKVEIMYTMSTKLERTWKELFNSVKDRTTYNKYDLSLRKPSIWNQTNNLNDLHMESISRWIEISSNVLCCLAHVLKLDTNGALEFGGSKLLQDSIDEVYTNFKTDFPKVSEKTKSSNQEQNDFKEEYMKIIKFNTRLQSDYERMLEKLRNERDEALAKAEQRTVLEKEIRTLKGKIAKLEQEVDNKSREIEKINENSESVNRMYLQVIKKNEELIASNQKLIMDKSNFIDKDTAKQMVKQYYEEERRGGERKEDIVKLMERILDLNKKSKREEGSQSETRRSLLNEFMEFVNEKVEQG